MTDDSYSRFARLDKRLAETRAQQGGPPEKRADPDVPKPRGGARVPSSGQGGTAKTAPQQSVEPEAPRVATNWETRLAEARKRREVVLAQRAAEESPTGPAGSADPDLPSEAVDRTGPEETQVDAEPEAHSLQRRSGAAPVVPESTTRPGRRALVLVGIGLVIALVVGLGLTFWRTPEAVEDLPSLAERPVATDTTPDISPPDASGTAPVREPVGEPDSPLTPDPTPAALDPVPDAPVQLAGLLRLAAPGPSPEQRTAALTAGPSVVRAETPAPLAPLSPAPVGQTPEPPPVFQAASADWSDVTIRLYQTPAAVPTWMEDLVTALDGAGFAPPAPRPVAVGPNRSEVRFYHADDSDAAEAIGQATGISVRDFSTYRPRPAVGTLELWASAAPN